jgi:hypothetical protein
MLPLKLERAGFGVAGKERIPVRIKLHYESSGIKRTLTIIGNWLIGGDLRTSETHPLHKDESPYNNGVALTYFGISYYE